MPDSVINWSYPFAGNAASPLANLTSLAKANGGHYPMGANGLWHGGVHFDKGTDTVFDQSSVRCIADGEVIAYRIDEQYPISEYTGDIPLIKRAPFSTGFVLVRHRLALPPLGKTSTSIAPALTFYSLYMHLQDWAGYQQRTTLPRPEFWGDGTYRVETQGSSLNVRAEASQNAPILAALANGARVKIGAINGGFRKLLSIVSGSSVPALEPTGGEENLPGYLASKFLKAQYEPQTKDKVVVLDTPISIKAGALIGHLGQYQNQSEGMPQALLHLEVFSCEDVPAFIASSRAHAARLPDEQKTLLKIHKGASKLIPHRAGISASNPPNISDGGVTIGVDLILPQSLLDNLPANAKLVVPPSTEGVSGTPEIRWWRLDNLLADQDGKPISGWLAEQEMITTRHSPWEWEGYDFIENSERSAGALAYHLEALRRLTDDERANYQSMIDLSDKGPIKQRLHAILDGNGDRKITLEEIRTAISKPWHAQSIAQLITRHESEWFWNPGKWDELDELMDHSPTVPNLDWVEEKKRIEKLAWWKDLAGKYGIAADGVAWHFHTLELIGKFHKTETPLITMEMLQITKPSSNKNYYEEILPYLNEYAHAYKVNTPLRIAHFLAQIGHESGFRVRSENGNYSATRMREIFGCKGGKDNYVKATDECSLGRLRNRLWTHESEYANNPRNLLSFVYASRMGNGDEASQEGYKFRGRGIIQLTGKNNYRKYTEIHNRANPSDAQNFVENPDMIATITRYGIESGFVYWAMVKANDIADTDKPTDLTLAINGGMNGHSDRVECLNKLKEHMKL
ncbi:hypothetical protein D7241_17675 [Stutzerimonas sp. VN223-3]|uniref:hypothetical protein n=1 Tax=Stutzerimonas sp. VN223-3 TaxID=3384601 RepID=UPI0038B49E52